MRRWHALPDLHGGLATHRGTGLGLFRAERTALAAVVQGLPGEWFTREYEARDHILSLVLPRDEWDERLPLFLLWRGTRGLLHLCMGCGSEAIELGCFARIIDLTDSLEREVRLCLDAHPDRDRSC